MMNNYNTLLTQQPVKVQSVDWIASREAAWGKFKARIEAGEQTNLVEFEQGTLNTLNWKPWTTTRISNTRIPTVEEAFRDWAREMDDWHLDEPSDLISFDSALSATVLWCRHKDKRKLIRFLTSVDFPPRYLQAEQISEKAYQIALEIWAVRRRDSNRCRMRKKRNLQVTD